MADSAKCLAATSPRTNRATTAARTTSSSFRIKSPSEHVEAVEPAVDGDHRAGEVAGIVGAEERDGGGELVVAADAADVREGVELGLAGVGSAGERRVADDDPVARHTEAGGLLGDRRDERFEAGLRRRVPG